MRTTAPMIYSQKLYFYFATLKALPLITFIRSKTGIERIVRKAFYLLSELPFLLLNYFISFIANGSENPDALSPHSLLLPFTLIKLTVIDFDGCEQRENDGNRRGSNNKNSRKTVPTLYLDTEDKSCLFGDIWPLLGRYRHHHCHYHHHFKWWRYCRCCCLNIRQSKQNNKNRTENI